MSARRSRVLDRLSAWMSDLQAHLRANAEANWGEDAPAAALGPAVVYRSMRAAFGPGDPQRPVG